jgi:uncharacterized protein
MVHASARATRDLTSGLAYDGAMNDAGRLAVFLAIALSIWTALHAFVIWSVARTPLVAAHVPRRMLLIAAALLWLSYPLGRLLDRPGLTDISLVLEAVGAVWMGVLFLMFAAVAASHVLRLPLLLVPRDTGSLGAITAALATNLPAFGAAIALVLGAVGLIQDARGPAVVEHEATLAGLPSERDGTVLVAVSDLHLGSLLGARWFERRLTQIEALRPDVIAVVGDLIDGNAARVERLLPELKRLHAPLGVLAVTGNHEYYAGLDRSVKLLLDAGYIVLRDRWAAVAPGLVFAGIDDLTARSQFAPPGAARPRPESWLANALADRPAGATVLLSHTPWLAEQAATSGVGLMLSGHTHDGQIWPFGYLVALRYPFMGGVYGIGAMRLIVCRGTGTWGPPLRLWRRSEIVRIVLRSPSLTRG